MTSELAKIQGNQRDYREVRWAKSNQRDYREMISKPARLHVQQTSEPTRLQNNS